MRRPNGYVARPMQLISPIADGQPWFDAPESGAKPTPELLLSGISHTRIGAQPTGNSTVGEVNW
jgi:hypothetical protein